MTLHPPNLPLRTGTVYRYAPRKGPGRTRAAQLYWQRYKGAFAKQSQMIDYLDAITLPASGLWAYGRIPKTGTNSVLALLHYLEFGAPITTQVADPANTSDDAAPHRLDDAGVFMAPLRSNHGPEVLDAAFRFTVLRHPVRRALSGFAYLCRSHDRQASQFAPIRLRMSAMTGFDWTRDLDTESGLGKYLDFLEAHAGIARFRLDRHVAPQVAALPREVFAPQLVGRLEDFPAFARRLAAQFGVTDLPAALIDLPRNAAALAPQPQVSDGTRARIESLFAADFDWYETA